MVWWIHEFHLTADYPEDKSNLIVWDQGETGFFLTRDQAEDVYRQVARILTTAYNFYTFEQISAWHHAAGDFILKPIDTHGVDLRLITIREYAPLIDNPDPDPAALVEGLLLFLINLSIRNRLDRLEGTGELAWADDYALQGTLGGFFDGLEVLAGKMELPEMFPDQFKSYIQAHSVEDLQALFSAVVDKIFPVSPERCFVETHLTAHTDLFHTFLAPG